MSTTKETIREWIKEAPSDCTHVIIACDTLNFTDYPVYVCVKEKFWDSYDAINGPNLQKVVEVYDMSISLEAQLKEERSYNCPANKED